MLPVFMNIAARRNILFYARLRRENFFDKLQRPAWAFIFCHSAVPRRGTNRPVRSAPSSVSRASFLSMPPA